MPEFYHYWSFTAYCLAFETMIWVGAGALIYLDCVPAFLGILGAAIICASNDRLKLSTWRGDQ
jgi:hypothetical protein